MIIDTGDAIEDEVMGPMLRRLAKQTVTVTVKAGGAWPAHDVEGVVGNVDKSSGRWIFWVGPLPGEMADANPLRFDTIEKIVVQP